MTRGKVVSSEAIVDTIPERDDGPKVVYRIAGDAYLLVEYGEMVLDLNLRFRIQSLAQRISQMELDGFREFTPGVRSLLIHYDGFRLPLKKLVKHLKIVESQLPHVERMVFPSRLVTLPLAFHDRWTREAIQRYMKSVRSEGPYLPDNVDFVARCNGLEDGTEVLEYLTSTQLLVLGLGDVYLGAPCAVPLDPRRRLVVPKYNPARTYTPEGGVGIGGTYICIYPMESPGGYQLVGRTLPIWSTLQNSPVFGATPWLLRFFDRIRFRSVSEDELEESRGAMISGDYHPETEEGTFVVRDYNTFVASVRDETETFRDRQKTAAAVATRGY
jgi:urea carboxylase